MSAAGQIRLSPRPPKCRSGGSGSPPIPDSVAATARISGLCHEETHAPQQDEDPLGLVLTRGPTNSRSDVPKCEAGGLLMEPKWLFWAPRTSSYGVVDVAQPI